MFYRHLGKVIYILISFLVVMQILNYESGIQKDQKQFAESTTETLNIKVETVPTYKDGTAFFNAKPIGKTKIRSSVYVSLDYAENLDIYPGALLTLSGTLSVPDKGLNPTGNDFCQYLKSIGSSLIMRSNLSRITDFRPSAFGFLYKLRRDISEKILFYLPPQEAGVVIALVTGDKSKIADSVKESYTKAGIYHLLAVSGLHLNMVILALMCLYMKLGIRKRLKTIIAFILTGVFCFFMMIFTGFGMSVTRAVIMAVLLYGAPVLYREYSPVHSLLRAFVIIIIFEPYAYINSSFCLSFSATAGIISGVYFIQKYHIDKVRFAALISTVILSVFSSLMTLPFVTHYFGAVSLISPLSNLAVLVVAPLLLGFSYISALICAFFSGDLAYIASGAPTALAKLINMIAAAFSSIPSTYINLTYSLTAIVFFGFICTLFLIFSQKKSVRIFVCALFVVANTFNISYNIIKDNTKVIFLNASQGDCSIICTDSGKCVMIDCGSEDTDNFGTDEVKGYLSKHNISKIDILFITHFHTDHTNGIRALIENNLVKRLAVPARSLNTDEENSAKEIYRVAAKFNVPIEHLKETDRIVFEKEHIFDIVGLRSDPKSTNESSMVISYNYGNNKILFPGDIEEVSQYVLTKSITKHNIIKVPHHGGSCTLSKKFADTLDSEYAVISCGINNKYSHPANDTLDAYKDSHILRTDKVKGPIVFSLTKTQIKPR